MYKRVGLHNLFLHVCDGNGIGPYRPISSVRKGGGFNRGYKGL